MPAAISTEGGVRAKIALEADFDIFLGLEVLY